MNEPLFGEYPDKTHMPFFDERLLVFCVAGEPVEEEFTSGGSIWRTLESSPALRSHFAEVPRTRTIPYRAWKLHYALWSERVPRRIETGLPAGAVECNPTFYWEDGQCHVAFAGGVSDGRRLVYHLYEMTGPAIDRLGPPRRVREEPTPLGFVSPRHVCYGQRGEIVLREKSSGREQVLQCPLAQLYRVAFRADRPEQVLLTGSDEDGQRRTLLYDLATQATYEVHSPEPVYKAGLCGGRIVFAERLGRDFEDRQLRQGTYQLVPTRHQVQRPRSQPTQ